MGRILNNFAKAEQSNTYPPYNITKINHDSYKVSIALAGFEAKDISIILEKDILTIKSKGKKNTDENYLYKMPDDEWQAISLSYTSGTTGNPKGVVYHHRGSYLMSTGSAVAWNMPNRLNFLTIVPMFHCNGWCYPWTIAMLNGRTICLRNIDVKKVFALIDKYLSLIHI